MDSPGATAQARSPPPQAVNLVTNCVREFSALLRRIEAKRNAIARLDARAPRSIATKMDLKISAMLEAVNPAQATALKTQFASQLAANEAALHATIKASARAELAALEATLPQMPHPSTALPRTPTRGGLGFWPLEG
ncbi:hypothetical protein AeRB84_008045 [Aphanomyces euteiches]|nr:hypothetical protein AeRB84_008045 [Aphanomyces euteiches]